MCIHTHIYINMITGDGSGVGQNRWRGGEAVGLAAMKALLEVELLEVDQDLELLSQDLPALPELALLVAVETVHFL